MEEEEEEKQEEGESMPRRRRRWRRRRRQQRRRWKNLLRLRSPPRRQRPSARPCSTEGASRDRPCTRVTRWPRQAAPRCSRILSFEEAAVAAFLRHLLLEV